MGEERENDLKKTSPPPMGNQQPGNRGNNNTPPNRQGGPSFDRLILFFLIGWLMRTSYQEALSLETSVFTNHQLLSLMMGMILL